MVASLEVESPYMNTINSIITSSMNVLCAMKHLQLRSIWRNTQNLCISLGNMNVANVDKYLKLLEMKSATIKVFTKNENFAAFHVSKSFSRKK